MIVDPDIDGTQLADQDLRRAGPEPHPLVEPRAVDIDRALMPEPDEVGMNKFYEFIDARMN